LPQIRPSLLCQFRQLTARSLAKPGVRRIGNVLFPSRSCRRPRAWCCSHQ
jgi:hypothetical protein